MTTDPHSNHAALLKLREQLASTRHFDRPRLARAVDRLFARKVHDARYQSELAALTQQMEASLASVERLRAITLRTDFDSSLPINAHREEITDALRQHQVLVVCGARARQRSCRASALLPGVATLD